MAELGSNLRLSNTTVVHLRAAKASPIPGPADSAGARCPPGLRFLTSLPWASSVKQHCSGPGYLMVPRQRQQFQPSHPDVTMSRKKKGNMEWKLRALSLSQTALLPRCMTIGELGVCKAIGKMEWSMLKGAPIFSFTSGFCL